MVAMKRKKPIHGLHTGGSSWVRRKGRLAKLDQPDKVKGNPRDVRGMVQKYAKLHRRNPHATTKSKRKRKVSEKATCTFETLVEDVLLLLFDILDPRDVAAMVQVERFLFYFVKRTYYLRIVLPRNDSQKMKMDRNKFVLRLESNCSPCLLKNQLQNTNLKKLREIKMVVPSKKVNTNFSLNLDVYDKLLIELFLKSPMLKKVEMFVHADSKDTLMKFPKQVNELCINFGNANIFYSPDRGYYQLPFTDDYHHHLSSVLQVALDHADIRTLKLSNMGEERANILKLYSESLVTLEFENVNKFILQELKFPNLRRLNVKDSFYGFSASSKLGTDFFRFCDLFTYSGMDIMKVIYEGCPKLTHLFGLDVSCILRELGFGEWKTNFARFVHEAADGDHPCEITLQLCKSLKEFNILGIDQLPYVYDSEDDISDLDDAFFGLEDEDLSDYTDSADGGVGC